MKSENLLRQITSIELEMKQIGFWSSAPPDLQSMIQEGKITSYLDAPTFELWLQCIFIPNVRTAVQNNALPTHSEVGQMAMRQYNYHSIVEKAQTLLSLLEEFDATINRNE